jgi:hypothetical protein
MFLRKKEGREESPALFENKKKGEELTKGGIGPSSSTTTMRP